MRSPVSVGFIQRLLDYVEEETGDQDDRFAVLDPRFLMD